MEITQLNSFDNCFSATLSVTLVAGATALTIQQPVSNRKVRFLGLIVSAGMIASGVTLERITTPAANTASAINNVNSRNPLAQTTTCQAFINSDAPAGTVLAIFQAAQQSTQSWLDLSFLALEASILDGITVRFPSLSTPVSAVVIWREF